MSEPDRDARARAGRGDAGSAVVIDVNFSCMLANTAEGDQGTGLDKQGSNEPASTNKVTRDTSITRPQERRT